MPFQRLSVQLYSLRRLPNLDDQLQLVRDAGLDFVELTSANFNEVEHLRDLLDRYDLRAPSGHMGLESLENDFDGTVAAARRIGTELLVLWGLPEGRTPRDAASWRGVGRELGRIASRLADEGLRFAFHNHDWELQRFEDGDTGLDHFFAGSEASPLRWQADLAWLARGGADVPTVLAHHADRLVSAHVKDLAPAGTADEEDGWADLGSGTLPWPAWLAQPALEGVDLLVLEHDEPSDPARFLRRSTAAARRLLPEGTAR